jgi:hypothetical protein
MKAMFRCWRILGEIEGSISNCKEGDEETCLDLRVGESCRLGMTVVL